MGVEDSGVEDEELFHPLISTKTPFSWVEQYDYDFAKISNTADWKDVVIGGFSLSSLASMHYFAVVN